MREDSYKCDCCGIRKGETNHWYKFRDYPDKGNGAEFIVNEWDSEGTEYTNTKHLCSDACVVKTVNQWLTARKEISQKGEQV